MPDDLTARARGIAADALAKTASTEPRPLFRPLPTPEPYPVTALASLRPAAEALHICTQAPMAMCGQSVLAAATLACQPHADVVLPSGTKPLTSLFVTIAESGERKSSVDRLAVRAVTELEEELRQSHVAERAAYAAEKTAWDAARDEARKLAKKGGKAAVRDALLALGPEPRQPTPPMILVSDPTPEGLVMHLEVRPWAGLFTAEGGLLVGGHGFSDESRMRTAALFNSLWDGEPIRRRRVGTGLTFLAGRRCAMHVMLQPVAADRLLSDGMLEGLGLTARMLVTAPVSTAGTRRFREPTSAAIQELAVYGERMKELLRLTPTMDGDALTPDALPIAPAARELWVRFHDHVEVQLAEGRPYRPIRGFGAKMAEHAGRLAGVLAFYEHGGRGELVEVTSRHMASGIELAQHYAGEMLRLLGAAEVSGDLRTAQAVLDWLKSRPTQSVHLADVYQRGPASVRNAASARNAMEILAEHGHVRQLRPGTLVDGVPRREAWGMVA